MAQFLALPLVLGIKPFGLLGKTALRMVDERHKRNARIVVEVVQLIL
ncbi:MAG: hypothetical protein WBW81_12500 [Methylocella sp.]